MKKTRKKSWYVTFQIKPTQFVRDVIGYKTKYYAVRCTENNWQEIASDINSLDGVAYIRLNKCGRLHKGVKILEYGERF